MGAAISERQSLWDDFLKRWPIENLMNLSLSDYCQTGNKDSFTYWLEFSTKDLGSISGGSAFKYGVYSRKNQSERLDGSGKSYNEQFAWYTKYGKDVDAAFETVKELVKEIANAARNGDLAKIDQIDLGDAFKWKIAFLYQDRNQPTILPVYNSQYLRLITDSNEKRMSVMHAQLMRDINNRNVFEYIDELWVPLQKKLKTELSTLEAKTFLDRHDRFHPVKPPNKYMAGYQHVNGHQLALALENKKTTFYFKQGSWIDIVKTKLQDIVFYKVEKSRSSNLAANAPQLVKGNPIIKAIVPNMDALIAACDAYENFDSPITQANNSANTPTSRSEARTMHPLNQILYGPPGTGKTFATIDEALRILDEDYLIKNQSERSILKARFDELVAAGHIRFVTFHQSFCYEDFVEGLRAETGEDKQLSYEVKDGIFKEICASAAAKVTKRVETHIDLAGKKVWKMSLGNTQGEDAYIYDECIENGYALLGYGGLIDFGKCNNQEDVYQQFLKSGKKVDKEDYSVKAVSTFLLKMKLGDLVVVSNGNTKFRAIGEITGDYICMNRETQGDWYGQRRDVKWLRVYKPSLPSNQLMHNQFSQKALYQLHNGSIDMKALASLLNVTAPITSDSTSNHFQVNEEFGGYRVKNVTKSLLELTKPNGNLLPISMQILFTLAELVKSGQISLDDIRDKKVFDKVSDTKLEPYLVNGYNTILRTLVSKIVSNKLTPSGHENTPSTENKRVLIIDEINRGNISRIFGELITLIEPSKREGADEALEIVLPYSKEPFKVPANVFIIGTMNTADRSLSGLDIALRRRFVFKEMPPKPELLADVNVDGVNIGDVLKIMNERIEVLLDREHCLGHAYFMPLKNENNLEKLSFIFRSQILPLLQEYFFEDWERIAWILNDQNKQSDQAFVRLSSNNLASLFGDTAESLQNLDKRWHINEAAFNNIQSYLGILGVTQ